MALIRLDFPTPEFPENALILFFSFFEYGCAKELIIVFSFVLVFILFIFGCNCAYSEDLDKDRIISDIGALVNRGKFKAALKDCNRYIVQYPDEPDLYYWRATIRSSLGNLKLALEDFNKSVELDGDNPTTYVMRGICKYNLSDYDGALADYNKAIDLEPKNISAYNMRAGLKLQIGDYEGADADFTFAEKIKKE